MFFRCASALLLATTALANDATEPPLEFEVRIGDEKVSLVEGASSSVTGLFDKARVSVSVAPYRKFDKSGVFFAYPRHFVFEADLSSSEFKSWTVEGSNVVLTLFVVDGEYSASEYVEEMLDQFGDDAELTNDRAAMKLGSRTFKGQIVNLNLGGQELIQAAYEVPLRGNRMALLVLQDSLTDTGEQSREWSSTLKLLSKSFALR